MSQVTIISGVKRRRVWTDEQKRALVAAARGPGASVVQIARRADLRPSQLYRWRRDLAEPATPGFAALTVSPEPEPEPVAAGAAVLEVGGAVLRIAAEAPPALVAAVVRSLWR
jgi:transposase